MLVHVYSYEAQQRHYTYFLFHGVCSVIVIHIYIYIYIYIYLKLNSVIGHFFLKKGFGIELNWVNMDQGPMKEYTSFAWSHHDFILFSNITIISTTTNEKYNGLRFVFIAPFIFQSSLNKIKYGLGLKL